MVLLLLVVVWAAVLGPTVWRRHAEKRSVDSIGAFHRQLHVLRKTGPSLVPAAHRLGTVQPQSTVLPGSTGLPVIGGRSDRMVIRPDTSPVPAAAGPAVHETTERRPDPFFRPDACRRRRDVLLGLVSAVVLTGLLTVVVSEMLYLCLVSLVALVTYVVLMVRLRMQAAEREVKLHYLPQAQPAPSERESAVLVRRVAAR